MLHSGFNVFVVYQKSKVEVCYGMVGIGRHCLRVELPGQSKRKAKSSGTIPANTNIKQYTVCMYICIYAYVGVIYYGNQMKSNEEEQQDAKGSMHRGVCIEWWVLPSPSSPR